MLRVKASNGNMREIYTNEDKAKALVNFFFPKKPVELTIPANPIYPQPLDEPDQLSEERIHCHIAKLSPHKVPGPDGIPNIILQRNADIIVPILHQIYAAILELGEYPTIWSESITAVIRKPGKPSYDVPKAYQPIAQLNTMGKVLIAIIAEEITNLVEKENLLSKNHFGGHLGCTTTDAIHLLVHCIKSAWQKDKVASILFLDVEGAFLNTVMERVIHNLRRRAIPEQHIQYVSNLLKGWTT